MFGEIDVKPNTYLLSAHINHVDAHHIR